MADAQSPRRRIGAMRMRFVIETPISTPDMLGGATIGWQPGEAVWGRIEARGGSEPVIGDRIEARVLHRIVLRFREGMHAGMRLRAGARLFELVAVFITSRRNAPFIFWTLK